MKKFIGFALTSCLAAAALAQLNPTVQRLSRPSGPVPPDCDTSSTVAAAPRLQVSEIPEPAPAVALPPVAPPSTSLRSLLRETRAAADAGDREAFRSALAAAKQTLSGYPAGGEKRSAEEVVRVYDDLDRLWTYQYESPTGAFFDESSDVYRIVTSYPGYTDTIRRQTLTVGGRRLYPSTESRRFLAAEGARRLGGGKAAPPVVANAEPAPTGALKPVQPKRAISTPKKAISDQRPAIRKTAPKPERVVASKPAPARRTPAPAPVPHTPAPRTPAPAPRTPAPAPAHVTPIPAPAPAPVTPAATETTVTTASAAPPPAPAPAPPAPTTTTAPDTVASPVTVPTATDTAIAATESEPPVQPIAPKGRSMVVPVILILIGLGVLVVLFRASSS